VVIPTFQLGLAVSSKQPWRAPTSKHTLKPRHTGGLNVGRNAWSCPAGEVILDNSAVFPARPRL
jgi:hypothetical protein